MTSRWERERSAWVLAHSRAGTSARRRAELLARADRRGQRDQHGLAAAVAQDETTAPLWRRVALGEGRSPIKAITYAGACLVGGIVGGVGAGIGYGAYRGLWQTSPKIGRLWTWPWAAAAGIGAVSLLALDVPLGVSVQFTRRFPLDLVQIGPWWSWAGWQLVIALATVAWLIRAWGWAGVPKNAAVRDPRKKDGSFKATPDHAKVALDPEDDMDVWDRIKKWATEEGK
ncbi:hypothetical protein [Gordonia humi]|uniref:Uncharacterized protein n=1 Tax=Gordonia humi TaxID=686429 RepID=A0A840F0G8_9ACTN|nr:hypothetical protein [Gordonia humi]MBB4134789.1 hypothetical protein [Gordonia humi]